MLRGFLGLTGYYRRFVKGYASIVATMIDLLKKDNFHWDDEETSSLEKLKSAMVTAPVLVFQILTLNSLKQMLAKMEWELYLARNHTL